MIKISRPLFIFFAVLLTSAISARVDVVVPGLLSDSPVLGKEELRDFKTWEERSSIPETIDIDVPGGTVALPKEGERDIYGMDTPAVLAQALDQYMKGQGEEALETLQPRPQSDDTVLLNWRIQTLRVQTLIMMGRAADAEAEFDRLADLENKNFGTDISSRALRGEAKLWLNDFDGALVDFARVVLAVGNWKMPTSYSGPPSNQAPLVNATTAQVRAYTGLALIHFLQGQMKAALNWAWLAEQRYADIFQVAGHMFYGPYLPAHADVYYGRAMNLAALAAAWLVDRKDPETALPVFTAAEKLLDSIGFTTPQVTVAALRAMALLKKGDTAAADAAAEKAVSLAIKHGATELIWRVEILRSVALLAENRTEDAEAALRRAQTSVELLAGTLGTDNAKRRFGVSKDDITYLLARIDLNKQDFRTLFIDMERGRARAFADMLAGRLVAFAGEEDVAAKVRNLDARIHQARLINSSPSGGTDKSRKTEAALAEERQSLIADLRTRAPELADTLSGYSIDLEKVRQALNEGEVMAYTIPSRGTDPIQFLLIGAGEVRLHTLSITHENLKTLLAEFKSASFENFDKDKQEQIAAELNRLISPGSWGARKTIYIVPAKQIYFVPWGLLDVDVPVAVLPTGRWILRHRAAFQTQTPAIVIGDPETFGEYDPLPGARREAEKVSAQYGVTAVYGRQATVETLRARVGNGTKILHLATHAFFDVESPLDSGLVLSGNNQPVVLTAAEIFATPIKARLVILSACETGAGEAVAGEDFLGLPRSFYLGGATTVVNSLWPISDEGTEKFMETFHQSAIKGNYGQAWLSARDRLRAEGYPPMIYGAFILGGAIR